jgi:hypothetical protein
MGSHWLVIFKQFSTKLATSADIEIFFSLGEKYDRYFLKMLNPHGNCPHARGTCLARCHVRQ